jgi:peroxiredoxin
VTAGGMAPEFSAPVARGGSYRLADQRGHSLLLAFLNTRAEPGGPRADPSRAQVVFLQSMERQYRLKGLRVAIVDASALETGKPATPEQLLNDTYDWNLSTIPVLADSAGALARRYGVERAPATFLIRADGRIAQRWEGLLPVTELASALRDLLGRPALGWARS